MSSSHNPTLTRTPMPGLPGLAQLGAGLTSALPTLWETLVTWQERANQRGQLDSLDGRLLKDMGISRAEATRESSKPFWRP